MENKTFGRDAMASRKALFMEALKEIKVEGFEYVGQTKKGHVFEETETGAFVELTAVAKKEDFDFSDAESEYLEAIEAREAKAKEAEAKKLAREAKKAKKEQE